MALRRVGWICLILINLNPLLAQESSDNSLSGLVRTRYMSTFNKADLADFNILVSHGHLAYKQTIKPWLSINTQVNGLVHYGTQGITVRDGATGAGPIFEAGLWSTRNTTGNSEFKLSQLNAEFTFEEHSLALGRMLKNTPVINVERWPFPNALEGIWYDYKKANSFSIQAAFINRICPRQTGGYFNIGESIGKARTGFDVFGNPSQYSGNVHSNYILISNVDYQFNPELTLSAWNYYVDNVSNTSFLEFRQSIMPNDLSFGAMLIYQTKVGNGGNADPNLAYQNDDQAFYWGLRAETNVGTSRLQVNVDAITDAGRMLLPREWGLEPFYTFQRRTRVEGQRDVASVMMKWLKSWSNEQQEVNAYVSLGRVGIKDPMDLSSNKNQLPRFYHLDLSVQYKPNFLKGLSADLYLAQRFSAGAVPTDDYVINRTDFFHMDFFVTYTFGK